MSIISDLYLFLSARSFSFIFEINEQISYLLLEISHIKSLFV